MTLDDFFKGTKEAWEKELQRKAEEAKAKEEQERRARIAALKARRAGTTKAEPAAVPPRVVIPTGNFQIESLPDRYRLHHISYNNGVYVVDWSKALLDEGKAHTQQEWISLTQATEWKIPDLQLYHATLAALYQHRDSPVKEPKKLVKELQKVFRADFDPAESYLTTSTRIKYAASGGDAVTHNWGYPSAREHSLAALQRFDQFKRKVSRNGQLLPDARNNNDIIGFVLKADIKHYFQTVDKAVLLNILRKRINDENIIWVIQQILQNYDSGNPGKGMPLGNWTSQFFANVYLNELDQLVKHTLKAKYYIRYVDDFVILHHCADVLWKYKQQIENFLYNSLKLELHPDKCHIIPLRQGVLFLGFRIFYHHKLASRKNIRRVRLKVDEIMQQYHQEIASAHDVFEVLWGWSAYAVHGNTYNFREAMLHRIEQKLSE